MKVEDGIDSNLSDTLVPQRVYSTLYQERQLQTRGCSEEHSYREWFSF